MKLKTKTMMQINILFALSLSNFSNASAQITYKVEGEVNVSHGDHSPLWLNANKQGLSSIEKNNAYIDAGIFKPMTPQNNKKISYAYGLELVGAHNLNADMFVQQAYLDLKYRVMQLSMGSKERNGELVNQQLSSGELDFSGNARPIPQIRVELPDYVTVPYTKGWLSARGHIAYGWFTDGGWQKHFAGLYGDHVSNVLYHSKALFLKIADPKRLSLSFEMGMSMYCQFGGTHYCSNGTKEKMPEGLVDYFKALFPGKGGSNTTVSDQENIEGNMLGCYHLSLEDKIGNWEIHPYYEHYYEDQSMMSGKYPWRDGLIGLEVTFPKNRIVSKVVMEYFGSMDQSGPLFVKDKNGNEHIRIAGGDDYYNHGYYMSWAHWGMALGNPLFMSPIYNDDHSLTFQSNRLTARHIGISGNPTDELSYRILASYTRNWGRYEHLFSTTHGAYPAVKRDVSTLFEMTYNPRKMAGWSFIGSAGMDRGSMMGNNTGVMLTIRKCGVL